MSSGAGSFSVGGGRAGRWSAWRLLVWPARSRCGTGVAELCREPDQSQSKSADSVRTGLYLAVLGLFALAIGAMVRHTAAGITGATGFVLVLAPLAPILALWPLGFGRQHEPTLRWWAERPLWIVVPGVFLLGLIAGFGRFEIRGHRGGR